MDESLNLKNKTDLNLLADLKVLVAKEREVLTQILHYLKEIEFRKLYLQRGFPSLFAMMTGCLGYSESAAGRRIQAMRLMRDIPEVEEKIEKGELSLMVAAQIQGFFRQEGQKRRDQQEAPITREEKIDLIQTLQGSSARECEKRLRRSPPRPKSPKKKLGPLPQIKPWFNLWPTQT